jgi:ABC-2 type transport system ATP-binding protein
VFSTHILSDLERVAFHLAFLSGGRIVLQAPQDALLDEVRSVSGPRDEVQALLRRLGAHSLKRTASKPGHERVLARLPAGTPWPGGVPADALSLEDLFLELA